MKETIYLDAAATAGYTSVDEVIINEITRSMKEYWMNPSSLYATDVKDKIDECRANIAKFIGAKSDEIYFTSGASESNNWVLRGFSDETWDKTENFAYIITSTIEHKSILNAIKSDTLKAFVACCGVDRYGLINYSSLEELLCKHDDLPTLVSVALANNEIGTCQHIKTISDLVRGYGGYLHVDATQAVGHIPIDVKELGIDFMSVSGHKISPMLKGIGFLYKKNGIDIKPLIYGAQEQGLRGGTENTFGIIGLSKAIEYCDVSAETVEEMIDLRNYFITSLESRFGCKLNGHPEYRLPNNINVILPKGIFGESVLYMLSMSNIFISTSSACNSKSVVPSVVLKEIGLSDDEAMRSIRITIPNDVTYEDVDYFISELDKTIKIIKV